MTKLNVAVSNFNVFIYLYNKAFISKETKIDKFVI
ncbi:MAG: hypothetical protein H6Q18_1085, partial [Bacteroidetes bacterium]|nr:hypothetical protein [Bacteroidota bacterium]